MHPFSFAHHQEEARRMAFISWLSSVSSMTSSVQLIIISSPSISGEILLRSSHPFVISGDLVSIRDILNGNGLYIKSSEKHVCSSRNHSIHPLIL
ncbi:hypothetical protein TNIN_412931 [Trichonephila inaurata madagascariensis]|uniref:Uncharacterized protein n=1 Tax=Trichonephila inaurata madagascariensis TaxID=2747483 RepID=A0A8X6Y1P0_9ARAC|nr:hypothetical protein TNIN_412931 [Trichonephila inaurata madagascariensis]